MVAAMAGSWAAWKVVEMAFQRAVGLVDNWAVGLVDNWAVWRAV